jgi:hypothetical protein
VVSGGGGRRNVVFSLSQPHLNAFMHYMLFLKTPTHQPSMIQPYSCEVVSPTSFIKNQQEER